MKNADQLIKKYPDRIPIHIEKGDNKIKQSLKKRLYLVPGDLTMGQFMYIIRKQLKLPPEDAMFIFCGYSIIPASAILSEIYDKYKDKETGHIKMKYYKEAVFG